MSVVRSASGEGASFSCSSRARTKWSIGLRTALRDFDPTLGGCGWVMGWKAQCFPALAAAADSGQTAPWSIQSRSKAIFSGGSASAFFGMRAISAWVPETACTSSEPADFPATKAGPCSPPLVASAFRSSRRPFSLRAVPWHFTQFASKIGWISFAKSTVAAHAGEAPSAAMAKPRRSKRWKEVVFMRRDSTDGAKAVSLQKSSDRSGQNTPVSRPAADGDHPVKRSPP